MNSFLRVYLFFLIGITFALLVVHSFSIYDLVVDNISIFLLIILILIPFVTAIKKFKWGEFEAEIDVKDVKDIEDTVNKTTLKTKSSKPLIRKSIVGFSEEEILDLLEYLYYLAEVDSVLAMAKLRIELEKLIKGIYLSHGGKEKRSYSINLMMNYLINKKIFESDVLKSAKKIINVCNQVIHGEKIETNEAIIIVKSSAKLFGFMAGYSKALEFYGKLKKG